MFEPWLGNGILLSGGLDIDHFIGSFCYVNNISILGEKWRLTRRLMTPAFHFKILDTFFDVFNKNAAILTRVLAKEIERSNTREIDMIPFMKRCTLDIICGSIHWFLQSIEIVSNDSFNTETAMGISINAQLETDSRYIQAVAEYIFYNYNLEIKITQLEIQLVKFDLKTNNCLLW